MTFLVKVAKRKVTLLRTIIVALVLVGCTSPKRSVHTSIANSVWSGTMSQKLIDREGEELSDQFAFALVICNGVLQIWSQDKDGSFYSNNAKYERDSMENTHLFRYIKAASKQPDWEEIQTYAFLDLRDQQALVQWTRIVNNQRLAASDSARFFYSHGIAHLKRVSNDCEVERALSQER